MLVTLDRLGLDGDALGKGPDGVVRVQGALPGDQVEVEIQPGKAPVRQARVLRTVTPSPSRRPPLCSWQDRCGGCDLGGYDPEARIALLRQAVAHAMGLSAEPTLVRSPRPRGYRSRISLGISGGRVGYKGHGTSDHVAVTDCGIARPEVDAAVQALAARTLPPQLDRVELRSDGHRVVHAFTKAPGAGAVDMSLLEGLDHVAIEGKTVVGDGRLRLEGPVRLRASPKSFYQVNLEANALLRDRIHGLLHENRVERVLDLYAGIGNFTLPLAAAGIPVVAVESEGQATDDLRFVAQEAGLTAKIEIRTLPVEKFDASRVPFDAAILDPPRAGAPEVLGRLLRNRPRVVVYVSCNLASARRDLKEAQAAGYKLDLVELYDFFPETHHVETLLVLKR